MDPDYKRINEQLSLILQNIPSKYWVNDRIYPRRAFIYAPNAGRIDQLIQEVLGEEMFSSIKIEPASFERSEVKQRMIAEQWVKPNKRQVSWQHINLHGEYDFSDEKLQDSVGLEVSKFLAALLQLDAPTRCAWRKAAGRSIL